MPQDQLENITSQRKEQLTKLISAKLSSDIQLDLSVVPITSVYVAQVKQPSLEEKMSASTEEFLDALYRTAYLLNIQNFLNEKNILVATFYTEDNFDKDQFATQYEEYIQDHYKNIEVVLVNWEAQ
ncbi:MAG: hypothetical protein H6765_07985 [Candidatus Peribacteria bacterium]|nr:MAG: hypothetical protein H6765_07985 [Candidatus Peribacteria bacterium]